MQRYGQQEPFFIGFEVDVNYKQPKCSLMENVLNKRRGTQATENHPGYGARRGLIVLGLKDTEV